MIDQSTPKGRVLAAALACAARQSWAAVSLADIAGQDCRSGLARLRTCHGPVTALDMGPRQMGARSHSVARSS